MDIEYGIEIEYNVKITVSNPYWVEPKKLYDATCHFKSDQSLSGLDHWTSQLSGHSSILSTFQLVKF